MFDPADGIARFDHELFTAMHVLDHLGDESVVARVRQQVVALCRRFPVYDRALDQPEALREVA